MNNKKPLFECTGTICTGYSYLNYLAMGIEGRLAKIHIYKDRIILSGFWMNRELLSKDIKSIKIAKLLTYKIGIRIYHISPDVPPYIRFNSFFEKRMNVLLETLIEEGYPVDVS